MHYLDHGLAREIRERMEELRRMDKSFWNMKSKKAGMKFIDRNAKNHSYWIEYPHALSKKEKRSKAVKEGTRNLHNAFEWGKKTFKENGYFDKDLLFGVAQRVNPEQGYLRMGGVFITGSRFVPPGPYKLISLELPFLYDLVQRTLDSSNGDPVQQLIASIHAHYHIARIHPLNDGNGRTARTIQDIILDSYGLPLPVIPSTERSTYIDCLEECNKGWHSKRDNGTNGATEGERIFYTFIAGKVNTSLSRLVD